MKIKILSWKWEWEFKLVKMVWVRISELRFPVHKLKFEIHTFSKFRVSTQIATTIFIMNPVEVTCFISILPWTYEWSRLTTLLSIYLFLRGLSFRLKIRFLCFNGSYMIYTKTMICILAQYKRILVTKIHWKMSRPCFARFCFIFGIPCSSSFKDEI